MSATVSARKILTPSGWISDAAVEIDDKGYIASIGPNAFNPASAVGLLLPGMANVHTHSFQRAMAGLGETRGPGGDDDFWSWRKVMYRFLGVLSAEDIQAIAAQVQMGMAEAGFTAAAEFHYLHHQPGGAHYDDIAETSGRIMAASETSGLGLTHLPVLYTFGGLDKRALGGGQQRFGCSTKEFEKLFAATLHHAENMPDDFCLGVAPHSIRAVDQAGLETCLALCPQGPIHIHAAEQIKEVEDTLAHLGARPVRWLLDHMPVDRRWCLIHSTHLADSETADLARSGAVAGLCPTTEANLGDGIFPAGEFLKAGGQIAIGSDSNIRLSVAEELRALETSQRLKLRRRTILADDTTPANGRFLYERAAAGGAHAIGRNAGAIEVGKLADLAALRDDVPFLDWPEPDDCINAWIFGVEEPAISDVWSAGRRIVRSGQHIRRDEIQTRFKQTMDKLRGAL